jgi:hypothetical protein
MAYRGDDLDLRTPRTWSATPADLAGWSQDTGLNGPRGRGSYGAGRNGPIWVDETVLACVNHAYDVALAHRSNEVRLEHLLHALTRIDAAAEELESRGVRVAALRRESATVIASEIPVGLTNGKSTPRRSEELEHVLRASGALGARRGVPAGINELLHLILDVEPDLPGLALLTRISPRQQTPMQEPLFASRPVYVQEPRYEIPEPPRVVRTAPPPPPVYYQEPVQVPQPPPVRVQRGEFGGTATDNIQNSRLDALEQMMRALSSDLSNERRVFTATLQDMQREMSGMRDDSSRFVEIANTRSSPSLDLGPLVDRIATLERAVAAGLDRLNEAVQTVETKARKDGLGAVDLSPIINRLDIIEEAVLSKDSDVGEDIVSRLRRLEDGLGVERTRAAEVATAMSQAMARQKGELAVAIMQPLMETLERNKAGQVDLQPVVQRVEQIQSLIETRQSESSQGLRLLSERMAGAERLITDYTAKAAEAQKANASELSEVHDALMKLNSNQHTLAGSIDQWRSEGKQTVTALTSQMDNFGLRFANMEGEVHRPIAMLDSLTQTVDKMHRVTVERYHRRNRFWYWLFGTDDWVASSWPSQAARISDELKSVKSSVPVTKR